MKIRLAVRDLHGNSVGRAEARSGGAASGSASLAGFPVELVDSEQTVLCTVYVQFCVGRL
jgi:hypothetical protein